MGGVNMKKTVVGGMTRQELLLAYREGEISAQEVRSGLERLKGEGHKSPLSEGQKGLWALQKMFPETSAYNVPCCLQLRGNLDKAALERACRYTLETYPVLKSVFREEKGVPYRVVQDVSSFFWREEDITKLADHEVSSYLQKWVEEPFFLEKGPLVRFHLLLRGTNEYLFLFVVHHIVFDGFSTAVFLKALFSAYRKLSGEEEPGEDPVVYNYDEYVEWEKKILTSRAGEGQRLYWKEQLSGKLPVLELPADFPRPLTPSFSGQTYSDEMRPEVSKRIKELAQSQGVNPSVVLLAAFKVLLFRYTGEEDIIVGMPTLGREEERFQKQIGLFINMLALRSRLRAEDSFISLLQIIQENLLDGLEHSSYPFPALLRELDTSRTQAFSPVFQVAFSYQNFLGPASPAKLLEEFADMFALEYIPDVRQQGEYELELEVFEREGAFVLNFKYHPDVFKPATITSISKALQSLLAGMAENPGLPVSDYPLLSQADKKIILEDWNATRTSYPADSCFYELFEQQAQRTPDALAVVYEEKSLTYRELDRRSTALALYLQAQGVGPECLVGICVNRSPEMILGLLGIMKAGGAYVPLEPDYPAERLRYMLQDSKPRLVVTQAEVVSHIGGLLNDETTVVLLDRDWKEIEKTSRRRKAKPTRKVKPLNLAYVMYTSGSTGKPKGVMVTQRGLTNFLCSMSRTPGLTADDVLLAVTTYCFDIAGLELYLPLLKGACCHLCSKEKAKDADKLQKRIAKIKPTVMQATPATWSMLFHSGWRNEEGVKILCGGEALPLALKQQFVAAGCEVWNMFGPTETTIWSTIKRITEEEPITIGKPIANTQIYILDNNMQPVPVSVPGELCIAGDGLARGYLNLPELTAEKFVDNPFADGQKLYKTGDLARWLPEGEIEFIGRIDHQVKVRGYRIELGEIEARLNEHPAIKDCVVIVKEDEHNKQLIAYYTGDDKGVLSRQELRSYLSLSLPEYMVPAHFIPLEEIPLTPSGKVDRKGLGARRIGTKRKEKLELPQSEIEEKVFKIYREILDCDEIGREEGFFDIGGNSLAAVIAAERINKEFGVEIPVTVLFKYPNISGLSAYLATIKGEDVPVSEETEEVKETEETKALGADTVKIKELSQDGEYPPYYNDSLAVIGISCCFPGAESHGEFWENLKEGKESVRRFSREELRGLRLPPEILEDPQYVAVQSTIEGKELFDPGFFNISPRDAEVMDPQLRLLLLNSWQAIEDAGYTPRSIPETAVFMAASSNPYRVMHSGEAGENARVLKKPEEYVSWVMAQGGTIPTMISHKLGLKGPSFFIHSNCSSSLAGLYAAYHSLSSREAKYALVGAATVYTTTNAGYIYRPGMNFSAGGRVRTFDAGADGMVAGEGVAVILLKNALEAIRDGDHIYALVRGIGVNNDGADKVGFYAPGIIGQTEVIVKALEKTGIDPTTVSYVEAHGTGTELGDPIEFTALSDAYRRYTEKKQFCGIGSVKTNIGHLDTAAGLAGCIKVALSLYHKEIPPTINYEKPNPKLSLEQSPFYVAAESHPYPDGVEPIRAALSSLGMGGTNAHAIFEGYVPAERAAGGMRTGEGEDRKYLVPLSAKTGEQLIAYAKKMLAYLQNKGEKDLPALAYTLQVGREAMENRALFLVTTAQELEEKLTRFVKGEERIEGCFKGEVRKDDEAVRLFERDQDCRKVIQKWLDQGEWQKLAELWARGLQIDWSMLYLEGKPSKLSLPTYPFNLKPYRLHNPGQESGEGRSVGYALPSSPVYSPDNEKRTEEFTPKGVMLLPAWEVVDVPQEKAWPDGAERIIVSGGLKKDKEALKQLYPQARFLMVQGNQTTKKLEEMLKEELKESKGFNEDESKTHLFWLASSFSPEYTTADLSPAEQEKEALLVFRTIKALLELGYGERTLGWTFITVGTQPITADEKGNTAQAALHGLVGSLAKEYPYWRIRLVDVEEDERGEDGHEWPWQEILRLPADPEGNAWVYRRGEWYRQKLSLVEDLPKDRLLYKEQGVYLVIGGAGGLGEIWSEYMIRNYRARLVWLGRRPQDGKIRGKLDRLAAIGRAPLYLEADAKDEASLREAYLKVKEEYGRVNGVVHSAVGVLDESLAKMTEQGFQDTLAAKIAISVRMAQVLAQEPLDFMLFFSSLDAFSKDHGKSGYSAGCVFTDIFAQRLSLTGKCAVKVMNWGYWGDIGIGGVVPEAFKKRLAQAGIGGLEPSEGMEALARLLASPIRQAAFLKVTKPLKLSGMVSAETVRFNPPVESIELQDLEMRLRGSVPVPGGGSIGSRDDIQKTLASCAAQLLAVQVEEIDGEAEGEDYGFDPAKWSEFAGKLNELYGLELTSAVFAEHRSLNSLAEYLAETYGTSRSEIVVQRQEMELLLCRLLWVRLQEAGFAWDGKSGAIDKLNPPYNKWISETQRILAGYGYLTHNEESVYVAAAAEVDSREAWQEWEEKKEAWLQVEGMEAAIKTVEATLLALPDILRGKVQATGILFPDSSPKLLEGIYKGNPVTEYFNKMVAEAVGLYFAERLRRDPEAKINILEVGAGTGGTSAAVLAKLNEYKGSVGEYCYTDISKAFLLHAAETYGPQNPYLSYKIFNVEEEPGRQGIGLGEYDLVIAANVLHATKNVRHVLQNVKATLKRNGLLVLNEINAGNLFSHLTFGLLEGWWLSEDQVLRLPGSPALSAASWEHVLVSEGFKRPVFPAQTAHELGQQIVITAGDGMIKRESVYETPHPGQEKVVQGSERARQRGGNRQGETADGQVNRERVKDLIRTSIAEVLKMEEGEIREDTGFAEYGVDSIIAVNLVGLLNKRLNIDLPTTVLFDYPSVDKLSRHIAEKHSSELPLPSWDVSAESSLPSWDMSEELQQGHVERQKEPIAIIGMSGRYAKSPTLRELWKHLAEGTDLVEEVKRWDLARCLAEFSPETTRYCRHGSFLEDIDRFDPFFFNISGLEATYMDPRQRLFLEESWKALEDAGYAGDELKERSCGIYVGCGDGDYQQLVGNNPPAQALWGNDGSLIPARISYFLDMKGPAMTIGTACSSSLVAIHVACQGLWSGETEMALAGGIYLNCTPGIYLPGNKTGMLSVSGRCYAFDERADGFVPGEGVGVVVLKRLTEAIADGDHIYGVIRGSGINQDGASNGITAPSALSQEQLETGVYEDFGIDPAEIQMVEAHGTGTILGDPLEFQALTQAFKRYTDKRGYCALGSIKSNLGHTVHAAGVTGLIKVLLALRQGKIPPTINYRSINPNIRLEDTPFYINTTLRDWQVEPGTKRRAAVSSFGLNGTNAHLVIEEAPVLTEGAVEKPGYLIVLSALTPGQLKEQAKQLSAYCREEAGVDCGNMGFTLLCGRKHLTCRLACVVKSREELIAALEKWLQNGSSSLIYQGEIQEKNRREQQALKRYGNRCLDKCREGEEAAEYLENLQVVAELYVQGYALDYPRLFQNDRYRRIPLPTYPFAGERYWVEETVPQKRVALAGRGYDRQTPESQTPKLQKMRLQKPELNKNWEQIDELLVRILWGQLQGLGLLAAKEGELVGELEKAGLKKDYGRWLAESAAVLARHGYLKVREGKYKTVHTPGVDVKEAWGEWHEKKILWLKAPELAAPLALVERVLQVLPKILTGETAATDVIFPDSSFDLVEDIYKNNPIADYFNEIMAKAVCLYVEEFIKGRPGSKISILEIGAGTGGTTAGVLRKLKPYRGRIQEYCYTDISQAFLTHAAGEYGPENPFLTYKIFNVEKPPTEQGIAKGGYDLVIAANVLHATSNIRQTLRNTKETLKGNGVLLLNEMKGNNLFYHLTFGLLAGWWLYEDQELRIPGCPALSGETWQEVLLSEGFKGVVFPAKEAHDLGQQIIAAETGGVEGLQVESLTPGELEEKAREYFKGLISGMLKIPAERIDARTPLRDYGLDSILVGKLTAELREVFENVTSTLFFELQTIDELVKHFKEKQEEALRRLLGDGSGQTGGLSAILSETKLLSFAPDDNLSEVPQVQVMRKVEEKHLSRVASDRDIAVVGIAGRYPGAQDIEEFWQNLQEGKDSITEIPGDRWEHSLSHKTKCKWGGFLKGVDQFAPEFFNITPQEANIIDPQERLFLEIVWELLENAGYTRESIAGLYEGNVGVYVGAMYQQYHDANTIIPEGAGFATSSCSYVASRVSYYFDFRGPSMAVDTACSSSAMAVHMACESLRQGECSLAVAGGVNLTLRPEKYLALSRANILGSSPDCRSFADSDGYLPAEGVGAVLLKPLGEAQRDGDHIWAVIKATSVNNGGRSGGYAVPNLHAQAQLMTENLAKAGVEPRSISYIEANANGMPLGDALEIAALQKVFRDVGKGEKFCALGSVKANIGHAEIASGISQLTKVILQLHHRQLVPTIKAKTLNPNINLAETPLYLQREHVAWERPVIESGGMRQECPRRATVSSFGGGGTNVHLVLEETPDIHGVRDEKAEKELSQGPYIMVFSAKSEAELGRLIRRMLEYVEEQGEVSLAEIAYTLQIGREAMGNRMAAVVEGKEQLKGLLGEFLKVSPKGKSLQKKGALFSGCVSEETPDVLRVFSQEAGEKEFKKLLQEKNFEKIAEYWTRGAKMPWELLYEGRKVARVPLPTYPFSRKRCWNKP